MRNWDPPAAIGSRWSRRWWCQYRRGTGGQGDSGTSLCPLPSSEGALGHPLCCQWVVGDPQVPLERKIHKPLNQQHPNQGCSLPVVILCALCNTRYRYVQETHVFCRGGFPGPRRSSSGSQGHRWCWWRSWGWRTGSCRGTLIPPAVKMAINVNVIRRTVKLNVIMLRFYKFDISVVWEATELDPLSCTQFSLLSVSAGYILWPHKQTMRTIELVLLKIYHFNRTIRKCSKSTI